MAALSEPPCKCAGSETGFFPLYFCTLLQVWLAFAPVLSVRCGGGTLCVPRSGPSLPRWSGSLGAAAAWKVKCCWRKDRRSCPNSTASSTCRYLGLWLISWTAWSAWSGNLRTGGSSPELPSFLRSRIHHWCARRRKSSLLCLRVQFW